MILNKIKMQGNWEKEKFHAQPHKNPKVIYDVNGNRSSSQNHCEVKAIVTMQIKVLKEAKEDKKCEINKEEDVLDYLVPSNKIR